MQEILINNEFKSKHAITPLTCSVVELAMPLDVSFDSGLTSLVISCMVFSWFGVPPCMWMACSLIQLRYIMNKCMHAYAWCNVHLDRCTWAGGMGDEVTNILRIEVELPLGIVMER